MHPFFIFYQKKKPREETIEPDSVLIPIHDHDIIEGGEFLDDAIRMHEQPYNSRNEKGTTGNSEEKPG